MWHFNCIVIFNNIGNILFRIYPAYYFIMQSYKMILDITPSKNLKSYINNFTILRSIQLV